MSLNDRWFNELGGSGSLNDRLYNYHGQSRVSFIENGTVASPIDTKTTTTPGVFSPVLIIPANTLVSGKNSIYTECYMKKLGAGGGGGNPALLRLGVSSSPIQITGLSSNPTQNLCTKSVIVLSIKGSVITVSNVQTGSPVVDGTIDIAGGDEIDVTKDMKLQFGVNGPSTAGDSIILISYAVYINT